MTWKSNPGCDLPPIKIPPGIQDVYQAILEEFAAQQLLFLANPTVATLQRKISEAQKIVEKGQKQVEQLKKYADLIAKYADLLNTCPCAQVWDEEASDIEFP